MAFTNRRYGGGGPDTGGASLGAMGNVGGSIPGLKAVEATAATLTPAAAVYQMQRSTGRHRAKKDYNDAPADSTIGTREGRVVKEAATVDPFPAL